jgi:hypothetical protein
MSEKKFSEMVFSAPQLMLNPKTKTLEITKRRTPEFRKKLAAAFHDAAVELKNLENKKD